MSCPIHTLPNEVFSHVFSFLNEHSLLTAQSVCTKWKEMSNEEALWRNLCFSRQRGAAELIEWKMKFRGDDCKAKKRKLNVVYPEVGSWKWYFFCYSKNGWYCSNLASEDAKVEELEHGVAHMRYLVENSIATNLAECMWLYSVVFFCAPTMRDGLIGLLKRSVKDFDESLYARLYENKHQKDFPLLFLGLLAAGWKRHCRFFTLLRNIFRYVERTTYENFQQLERSLFHTIVFEKVKEDAMLFANEIQHDNHSDNTHHFKILKQLQNMFDAYSHEFLDPAFWKEWDAKEPITQPKSTPHKVCFQSSDGVVFAGPNAMSLLTMSSVLQDFFRHPEEM